MATPLFTVIITAISHITYTAPIPNIKITNFGSGTSMFYAAFLSNTANDHVVSRFEIRNSEYQWFDCKDVEYAYKCSVDSGDPALTLPISIRLTANGEAITGYNKILDFTDGLVWDFGNNFQSDNIQIHNAGAASEWHYAAIVNGITPGYIISEFQITKDNGEWFVCKDLAFEFMCNVDSVISLPISVRLIANGENQLTLTSNDLITNLTDGLNFDFGDNYEAFDFTTSSTSTTSTTAATHAVQGRQDKGALIAGFVVTIVISLVIGIVIGVVVYRRQQKMKGYSSENLELKEKDENEAKKAELMKTTIDVKGSDDDENVAVKDDVDEDDDDGNDEDTNIVQP